MALVSVCARNLNGFRRCGMYWPHAETFREVDDAQLAVLVAEPQLIVHEVDALPPGWDAEGNFTAPTGGITAPEDAIVSNVVRTLGDKPPNEDGPGEANAVLGSLDGGVGDSAVAPAVPAEPDAAQIEQPEASPRRRR